MMATSIGGASTSESRLKQSHAHLEAPRRGAIRPGRGAVRAPRGRLQTSEERHHEGLGGGQDDDGEYRATRAPLDQSACGLASHYRARRYGFAGQGRARARPVVAEIWGCGPPVSPCGPLRLDTTRKQTLYVVLGFSFVPLTISTI